MNTASLKVSTRLWIGFGILLLMLVVTIAISLFSMADMQKRTDKITLIRNMEVRHVAVLRATVFDRMIAARNIVLLDDAAEMKVQAERVKTQEQLYAEAFQKLSTMFAQNPDTSAEEKTMFERIKAAEAKTMGPLARAVETGVNGQKAEATRLLMNEVRAGQFEWLGALGEMVAMENRLNEAAAAESASEYASTRNLMFIIGGLALLAGGVAATLITRSLVGQLGGEPGYAVKVVSAIASGDLTVDVQTRANDRSSLLAAMRDMRDNLVNIVSEVRSSADGLATASSEIASGNMDLSSRTEQQAGSLEETASSMEELTSTVKQNAENARQANTLAVSASDVAVQGGAVVAQVVQTMEAINDSSRKIVDIISVIDGIAFQTNILALNAAVEAARAGEQGRGFAVVASEVRSLAQRSANAAKEIKVLISESVEKVEAGSKLVDDAGGTMTRIVESVKRVTDIMHEITAATEEQRAGIEQVNQAISQMDTVTQQNAALVEEAASAAAAMQDQTNGLVQVVGQFRISGMASSGRAAATAKPMPKPARPVKTMAAAVPAAVAPAHKPAALRVPAAAGDNWEEF